MTRNPKADLASVITEEHRNCGGQVRLTHETWDCDRCHKRGVPVAEVKLVEVATQPELDQACTTTTTKDTP